MPDRSRQHWLSILARADAPTLLEASRGLLPGYIVLRSPEIGLIMLRGRVGGSGPPFNLGETTVVRCSVRSEAGHIGHAYSLGRDLQKAELAAAIDAGLQNEMRYSLIYERVIAPLEKTEAEKWAQLARRAAATQVQFYTMSTMRT